MTYFRRLAPALILFGTAAHGQGFENIEAVEMRVAAALGAGIGEPGGAARSIDRRLKLAACPQPVSIEPSAMNAVAVRCDKLGWRIRVPLVRSQIAQQSASAAKAEPIVRKGDQVELTASSGTFTVSTVAFAEQDGGAGDRIRVRTERKAAAVIGVVMADGRVSLPGFKQ